MIIQVFRIKINSFTSFFFLNRYSSDFSIKNVQISGRFAFHIVNFSLLWYYSKDSETIAK